MAKGRKISALSLFDFELLSLTVAPNKNAKCLLAYKILSDWVHGPLYCPFGAYPLTSNLSSGKQSGEILTLVISTSPLTESQILGIVRGAG